jgi:hypothetical protein
MWRAGFGRGFGPVVRQTNIWMNMRDIDRCLNGWAWGNARNISVEMTVFFAKIWKYDGFNSRQERCYLVVSKREYKGKDHLCYRRHRGLLCVFIIWNEKPTDVTISILFIYRRISTCFGPTGPFSGEFTQLFTQPLVHWLYHSGRVVCMLWLVLVTVGPKHVEIRRYMNKIEIVTSVGFSFHMLKGCTVQKA